MLLYGLEILGFGDVWWCGGVVVWDMCGVGVLEVVESGLIWFELLKVWWCGVGVYVIKNSKIFVKR